MARSIPLMSPSHAPLSGDDHLHRAGPELAGRRLALTLRVRSAHDANLYLAPATAGSTMRCASRPHSCSRARSSARRRGGRKLRTGAGGLRAMAVRCGRGGQVNILGGVFRSLTPWVGAAVCLRALVCVLCLRCRLTNMPRGSWCVCAGTVFCHLLCHCCDVSCVLIIKKRCLVVLTCPTN